MQTLSSARRTCMASASAVECTATVAIPSSLQARSTRSAISPRLAMRILSNTSVSLDPARARTSNDYHQGLAELDRLAVFDEDLAHRAGARRGDLVEGLHRLDEEDALAFLHGGADLDERLRFRR